MGVRSTVKAIILNDNKILLNKCYDINNGHYYSLPGGGQDKYESIYDAIIRECKEETGYNVKPVRFCGILEEICDNVETREYYSQYAHKLYHIFICSLADTSHNKPSVIDDMQLDSEWLDIDSLCDIRILPESLSNSILDLITKNIILDLGSSHIPYNHG